ncbi:myoneurin-like isoform X4 [Cryptotermes secundus]|uniref:myoneurin-like isoform X4 n=1 Tax=Cryptotermes secundus TaxID=105785 RepID=UPI001454D7FC|nr:myoneurin-like isoform X4 [Cryptotermes secundus]
MDVIKTEPCSDMKVERMSPLSEYSYFDITHKDLVSVVKNEDMCNMDVCKLEPEPCIDDQPVFSLSDDKLISTKEEESPVPTACSSGERKVKEGLWCVSGVESAMNLPVKDELDEEITIEEHEVRLDSEDTAVCRTEDIYKGDGSSVESVQKPHICNICHKSFRCPSFLVHHYRSHTGEKPYACEICNKTFSQKSNMKGESPWGLAYQLGFSCVSTVIQSVSPSTVIAAHNKDVSILDCNSS